MNTVFAGRTEYAARQKWRGLFVTDLDGTLLSDQRRLHRRDYLAMQQLRADGFATAIATGRSNFSFEQLVNSLDDSELPGLPVDFVIFSTGAGIMHHPEGNLLRSEALPRFDIERIVDKLEGLGVDYMVHWPIPETRRFMYRLRHDRNADFHRRLHLYHQWAEPLPVSLPVELTEATEILCILPEESGHDRAAQIAEMLPAHSVIKATSPLDGRSIWVEIFPPEVAKSHAVAWLASFIGLTRDQVGAVGNDYNDVDMLEWVANGFVVANSPGELQRDFRAVASNNEAGVAEAIVAWLQGR